MAMFFKITAQVSIKAPAIVVARQERKACKAHMERAIADFAKRGIALRIATDKLIVTEFGEILKVE